jgi:adenosylmethionine-8-amino-7-oxononanoate aminotransferase
VTEGFARHLMVDFTQMKSFAEDPFVIDRGEGIRVTDDRGRTYLDGLSGIFTNSLGHGNEAVVAAMMEQARRLAFAMPTLGTNTPAGALVDRYRRLLPGSYSTMKFLSGGSEANESALKLARQYHKQTGHPTKYKVLSHYRGYHGGTGHALAASGWARWKEPYEPFATGFIHLQTPDPDDPPVPMPSVEAAAELYGELARRTIELEGPDTIAAVITEPILMSAGIVVPPDAYLRTLRALCDAHDILLIYDEIITGFGRTGRWFGAEWSGAWPDILTCGKAISAGYAPFSAIFMRDRVADAFWAEPEAGRQFFSGHTYGGNPVACAAALAVLDYMQAHDVVGNAARVGDYLAERLRTLASTHPSVVLSRGRGLLQGLALSAEARTAVQAPAHVGLGGAIGQEARRRGLLLRFSPWFVAVAPPLVTTSDEVDEMVRILDEAISTVEETFLPAPLNGRAVTRSA